jgi:hypothetical protein
MKILANRLNIDIISHIGTLRVHPTLLVPPTLRCLVLLTRRSWLPSTEDGQNTDLSSSPIER